MSLNNMKELLQTLLEMANHIYPMRSVHTGWCTIGMFYHTSKNINKLYSFVIEGNRGTFRRVDIRDCENEWFDVIRTKGAFTVIIHNGIKYDAQPTLQL